MAGLLLDPDLAHLHVLVAADGGIVTAYATTAGGTCAEVVRRDELAPLAREAMRVCPVPGGGRIADAALGLWRVERYAGIGATALVLARIAAVSDRLEELGVAAGLCQTLQELGAPGRRGLVLILGDMRAGKSTLSATLLRRWLGAYGGVAFAWADPPEHDLEGPIGRGCCVSVEIGTDGYADAVVAARRSRARYFYFGEPRVDAAVAAVVQASLAGPVCLGTAHGYGLIPGLIAFSAAAARADSRAFEQLASALSAAIHVRLEGGDRPRLTVTEQLVLGQAHGDTARSHIRSGNVGQLGSLVRSAPRAA